MTTLEFFEAILPAGGVKYLVLFPQDKPYKIHKAFTDLEAMADAAAQFSMDPAYSAVYHACASFESPYVEVEKDGKTRKKYRIDSNWKSAKAFWIDVDCGKEKAEAAPPKGYLTKKLAAQAISKFAKEIGWPMPAVVDSGNGIHAYWPLERAIKHDTWCKIASLLKAASSHFGLIADPTRTADFASILRPVGTLNRKDADNPKHVDMKLTCEPLDVMVLAASLRSAARAAGVVLELPKPSKVTSDLNSDLTGHLEYPTTPVDGNAVAVSCAQIRHVRDTQGDTDYEIWRGTIGLLTHCENGRELAEAWTEERGNTGHSNVDWQTRFDTWEAGPTTCDFFEKLNADGCVGCPYKGKVKSPIVLGRVIPITVEKVVEVVNEDAVEESVTVPAMPIGYQWANEVLSRVLPDADGINQLFVFSTHLFYPTMRIKGEDGAYRIGMRMHLHNNRVRDFQMPFEAMASPAEILKNLAKYELMQTNHKNSGNHLTAYMRDSLEQLKKRVEETNTLTTFGWKDDMKGFLMGDRYYHQDGSVRRVLLGGYAANKSGALGAPVGTVAGYAAPINYVYDRPGMECMQYALCSGWGSILNPFCEELYCGLMVAITGGDSGKGKSTVAYASLYAFGNANAMAMKSDEAGTRNALWATVGAFNNIPLVFDELTKVDPEEFSKFAYTLSLGEEKARLQATGNGVKFANQSTWRMSPFVTANKDLHGVLAATQANSQAEAVRLIQIHVDRYPIPQLEETEVQAALGQMKVNRGAAGDALVRYAVTHTAELFDRIRRKVSELVPHVPGTKYRFYRNHAACTLVAAELAVELGIASFDVARLQEFAITLMQELAVTIAANNTVTSDDAFSRMVAEMTHGIVVTTTLQDSRNVIGETPRNRITGPIIGRYVLGSPGAPSMAGRLFLCQKAMREWCLKNRTDFTNVINHLADAGALLADNEKVTLTRGTDLPRVQKRCVVVDTMKLEAGAAPTLVVDNTTDHKDAV